MPVTEVVIDSKNARRLLARISKGLSGGDERVGECLEALGAAALRDVRREFVEHSRPGNPFWPMVGFATAILRPGGQKLYGDEDVERKRASLVKMRVKGTLLDSLAKGAPGNVFRTGRLDVEVGTRDSRAAVLHRGGRTKPFEFTEELQWRFAKNVSRTKPGSRTPRALKSGKRRKWKARGLESR